MSGRDIGSLIDDIQYTTTSKVYDIDYDIIVKFGIIFEDKRKSLKGLLVFLAVMTILGEIFKYSNVNIVTGFFRKYI